MPCSDASSDTLRRHFESTYLSLRSGWCVRPVAIRALFFVEVFGVWAFALYWLVKSWEIRQTSADRAASQGILEPSAALERARMPGRLVQTAPLDQSVDELRLELGFEAA